MAKQFVHAQANSSLFLVMLKMVVFVTHLSVHPIMTVRMEFAAMVSAQWLVEIKLIAPMVNIVRIIDA